jgi:uncharacterized protein involved in exopolysaccharide biosynthesis
MQIQYYVRILRKSWWVIAAMFLICVGVGVGYSYSQVPIYEATATFVVNPGPRIADTYDLLYSIDTLAGRTSLATTYSNVLKSRVILEGAAASLRLPIEMLADYKINCVVLPDSNVLQLRVQGPSPDLATDLANAVGAAGLEYVSKLQEIYELRRLDWAVAQREPISPDHPKDVALSGIVGVIGGLAFVTLRQLLQQSGERQPAMVKPTPVIYDIQSSE